MRRWDSVLHLGVPAVCAGVPQACGVSEVWKRSDGTESQDERPDQVEGNVDLPERSAQRRTGGPRTEGLQVLDDPVRTTEHWTVDEHTSHVLTPTKEPCARFRCSATMCPVDCRGIRQVTHPLMGEEYRSTNPSLTEIIGPTGTALNMRHRGLSPPHANKTEGQAPVPFADARTMASDRRCCRTSPCRRL